MATDCVGTRESQELDYVVRHNLYRGGGSKGGGEFVDSASEYWGGTSLRQEGEGASRRPMIETKGA